MTSVWTAPGRVNLIGEHTDYNDGFVLPFALPIGVTARATRRDDDVLRVSSSGYSEVFEGRVQSLEPGTVEGWAAYVAGVAWSLRQDGYEIGGADVALDSDLPAGAGLSSSAAVECAAAGALADLFGHSVPRQALVQLAHRAENEFVGAPTGVLDQSASVLCSAGHVLFLDVRSLESRQVPLPLGEQGLVVLIVDTRAVHRHADGEYANRRAECERAAARLGVASLRDVSDVDAALEQLRDDDLLRRRTKHVLSENTRVQRTVELLDRGADVRAVGPLLTASHESLRDDYEVSCRELDVAVDASLAAGAHGARMTGGGFGGSALALVDEAAADEVTRAVSAAFGAAGLQEPRVFAALPSDGARPISG